MCMYVLVYAHPCMQRTPIDKHIDIEIYIHTRKHTQKHILSHAHHAHTHPV